MFLKNNEQHITYDIRKGNSSASFPKSVEKYAKMLTINLGNMNTGNINFMNKKYRIRHHFSTCRSVLTQIFRDFPYSKSKTFYLFKFICS